MAFTHVEIEERKSRSITFLFLFLVVLYATSLLVLLWGVKAFIGFHGAPLVTSATSLLVTLGGVSLAFSAIHWLFATHRLFERVLNAIGAHPLDPRDTYHAKLANIIEEVSVATGGRRIEPYVIATPALNACAFADVDGRSAIAVTEGALAMLNRAQLESVIGHEAAHLVSGDSLTTSIFCGLFALHEEALKRLSGLFGGASRIRIRGTRAGALVLFIYLVLTITAWLKTLCSMLISREKEYRADAVAVRLTRNPLSLAEALSIISRRWRGVAMRGESLSSLFILDPGVEYLSEREGLFADLFSTHPPTQRRIELLLGMAHLDPARFDQELSAAVERRRKSRTLPAPTALTEEPSAQWMVWGDGDWRGPFGLQDLLGDGSLTPESWVRRVDEDAAHPAHQDPQLLEALRARYADPTQPPSKTDCPNCRVGLSSVIYEGALIERCPACQGCYVDPNIMARLLAREEYDVPESVKRMGDQLLAVGGFAFARRRVRAVQRTPLHRPCPQCGAAVVRQFYTEAYPVEVEKCFQCGLTWLDHQELELLQYLYEKRKADVRR